VSSSERLGWVDLAKGLTMVLVVLAHAIGKHTLRMDWSLDLPVLEMWSELNEAFTPMRMPLFFVLSGLLAASSLRRGWRNAVPRRVVNPYALYLLWFSINAVFLAAFRFTEPEALQLTPRGLLVNLVFPHTTLWYMAALAMFFVGALILRPLGPVLAIAMATALSIVVEIGWIAVPRGAGMTESILRYFFIFLVGALLPDLVRRVARLSGSRALLLTTLVYVAVAVAFRAGATAIPGFGPLSALTGATLGILVAVRLSDGGRLGRGAEAIGRRTLAIFVLHVPVLAMLHWVATGPGEPLWTTLTASAAVAAVYPVLVTAFVLVACLAAHAGLQRVHLGWLFALPIGRRVATAPESGAVARSLHAAG
jgi:uncharacterized membrane protein YcfT